MASKRLGRLAAVCIALALLSAMSSVQLAGAQEVNVTASATAAEVAAATFTSIPLPTATPSATATLPPTATPTLAPTSTSTPTPVAQTIEAATETPTVEGVVEISATPSPTSTPEPTSTATPIPEVSIRTDSADVYFGEVNGKGDVDPNVESVTSQVSEGGSWYIKERAIQITVVSSGLWSAKCWADIGDESESRLSWRLTGTEEWTNFETDQSRAGSCFATGKMGTVNLEYDLRLWVDFESTTGPFAAELGFKVEPTVIGP